MALLLLSGCNTTAQPKFDPNIRTMVSVGGKLYPVPYGSEHSDRPMPVKTAKWARRNDVDCIEGDIGWSPPGTREKIEGKGKAALLAAFRNGQLSCVHPLTKKEEKRYKAFVETLRNKIRKKYQAERQQLKLKIDKLKQKQAEIKNASIARRAKLKNANSYSTNRNINSYSTSSSGSSMQEALNVLNKQLNQMNSNMAKPSYYAPSNTYYTPSNYRQSSSASSSGYRGESGAKYQYDSSKYEDQIRYQYDYNAQHRDRMYKDYSGDRDRDTSGGQYGTGIYGQ